MILSVAANPCIDKTAHLEKLLPGELNRLSGVVTDYAGKGVNVARVVKVLGEPVIVTGLLGKNGGDGMKQSLDLEQIQNDFVMADGALRTNLKVLDSDGNLTELNEPGIESRESDWNSLSKKLLSLSKAFDIVVLSGSLPRNASPKSYRDLTALLKANGRRVIVDADGAAFREAVEAGPDLIKPNCYELMQYLSIEKEPSPAEWKTLAAPLLKKGISLIALSMGKDGALFISETECILAPGLSIKAGSPVGAGDSMVAALAVGLFRNLPLRETAALAIATSAAAATTIGTKPPERELIDSLIKQVNLKDIC